MGRDDRLARFHEKRARSGWDVRQSARAMPSASSGETVFRPWDARFLAITIWLTFVLIIGIPVAASSTGGGR